MLVFVLFFIVFEISFNVVHVQYKSSNISIFFQVKKSLFLISNIQFKSFFACSLLIHLVSGV